MRVAAVMNLAGYFSFVAPVNMVIASGARPVYADIDCATWCIDPDSVKRRITNKTKAIIAVHTYGNVCDMDALMALAKKHRLYIIEDAAEAAFSRYRGKCAGTFGDIGCFSFQATKTIAMGEGGFVLTADRRLYEKMRIIRDHGMRKGRRYWHDVLGYNFRLTNLQAAVGCGQLENSDNIISSRERVYADYSERLAHQPGISLQCFRPQVKPLVWAIAAKIDPGLFKGDRDFLINALLGKGIETRPGFYPFSAMPLYKAPWLPVSRDVGANVISLPSFGALSRKEILFVCGQLEKLRK